MKYDISDRINDMLLVGQSYKRKGMYEEANKIYSNILEIDGPSGLLYIAMAKNYACEMKFSEAIRLLELANEACKEENGVEDFNCLYHINQLKNRNNMPKEEFLEYMKSISGNVGYSFPR